VIPERRSEDSYAEGLRFHPGYRQWYTAGLSQPILILYANHVTCCLVQGYPCGCGLSARPSDTELDAWVLATAPRAVAYARNLLHHTQDAEDVVQECYCRLLNRADVYDLPRDGLKLLLTAISNASINLRTRHKPWFRLVRANSDDAPDDPEDKNSPAPDAQLLQVELSTSVADALQKLPPQQRAAIELKAMDFSQQEIAEILGVTTTNVGVLIHRGRQTLAKLLEKYLRDTEE
jgi:RNA polymerase sigma factor (sigma-70 family)